MVANIKGLQTCVITSHHLALNVWTVAAACLFSCLIQMASFQGHVSFQVPGCVLEMVLPFVCCVTLNKT